MLWLLLWALALLHAIYVCVLCIILLKQKMQNYDARIEIPFPRDQRVYYPLYDRYQIDLFYEIAELAHNIILNEKPKHPTKKINNNNNDTTLLFLNPTVIHSTLFPTWIEPASITNDQPIYSYEIEYGALRYNRDGTPIPRVSLRLHLHNQSKNPIKEKTFFGCFTWLLPWGLSYFNQSRGIPITMDMADTMHLFRMWLLIPRDEDTTNVMITNEYNELKRIYFERKHFREESIPAFATGLIPRLQDNMSTWTREAMRPDILALILKMGSSSNL